MKNRRLRWTGMLVVMCLTAGTWSQTLVGASQETVASETEVSETESDEIVPGERTATIMVVSITGNELTYYEVQDESESESETQSLEADTSETMDESEELTADTEQGETESETVSANEKDMTPPEGMNQDDGNMTPPDDMPSDGFQKDERPGMQSNTKTVYLPVPVVVHTDTDERRTFSILEEGDKLQVTIVTDEEGNETITEIWMLSE